MRKENESPTMLERPENQHVLKAFSLKGKVAMITGKRRLPVAHLLSWGNEEAYTKGSGAVLFRLFEL